MTGLYNKTFNQKQTIKLSPDAVIHINDLPDVEICPICQGKMVISDYVTTITTSLANNSTVGTASFTITIPRHGHQGNYMVRGGRVFGINLMDEIEIYVKGRYPKDAKGNYEYYKVFWGLVTNIQESYSDGFQNISISCESILKWLQMMNTNEHPSTQFTEGTGNNPSLFSGKIYSNLNVYEIIYSMLNITYLNIIVPNVLEVDASQSVVTGSVSNNVKHPRDIALMEYWRKRFSKVKSSLKMFGASPSSFIEVSDAKIKAEQNSTLTSMFATKQPTTPVKINYDSAALLDFRPFAKSDDRKNLSASVNSYKSNLDIINEVKLYCGYEFYLDTNGDIIFKPPFWNLDTSKNTIFTIEDTDILSWDFSEDANQVVTRVEVLGSTHQVFQANVEQDPKGTFTDWALARQFGIKSVQIPCRFFTHKNWCYYHAISEMDRINANRYTASLSIIGRPELRLGYPVYIPSRDIYGYVDNISHNFSFGGQFTTQIELSAIRRKYIGDSTLAANLKTKGESSKSFGLVGKAAILLFSGESNSYSDLDLTKKELDEFKAKLLTTNSRDSASKKDTGTHSRNNRYGTYVEYSLSDPEAQKALQNAQKAKEGNNQEAYLDFLEIAIPVSDEAGYELIGSYENGRCLELSEDNVLSKKGKSFATILQGVIGGNGSKSNFGNTQPSIVKTPTGNGGTLDGTLSSRQERDTKSELSVANFSNIKSASLQALSPAGKDIKICSCYDFAMTGRLKSTLTPEGSGIKPISKTKTSGGFDVKTVGRD